MFDRANNEQSLRETVMFINKVSLLSTTFSADFKSESHSSELST